jgi:hypothetical protein
MNRHPCIQRTQIGIASNSATEATSNAARMSTSGVRRDKAALSGADRARVKNASVIAA